MNKVTKPNISLLAKGDRLEAKQMQAKAGDLLPKHVANMESVLFAHEGECILHINEKDEVLKKGDAFIVPPNIKHQIKAVSDFKGVHLMPKEIEFEFFK